MTRRVLRVILWLEEKGGPGEGHRMLRAVDKASEFWPDSKLCGVTVDGVTYVVVLNEKSVTVRRNE